MFNNILVVCVGNICRSPTAHYLLQHKLRLRGDSQRKVRSAGLAALVDKGVDSTAADLLAQHGVADYQAHQAQQLNRELIAQADLILVMEPDHLNAVCAKQPAARGKTFLLGKWQNEQSVPDPYRKSREAFEHVYRLIDQMTDDWLKYLR